MHMPSFKSHNFIIKVFLKLQAYLDLTRKLFSILLFNFKKYLKNL